MPEAHRPRREPKGPDVNHGLLIIIALVMSLKRSAGWSWAAAVLWLVVQGGLSAGQLTLIPTQSNWRFLAGYGEASTPDQGEWRGLGYADGAWEERPAVFYYGESGFSGTMLSDMPGRYVSFYLRKTFVVSDVNLVSGLTLRAMCDDGYVAWINGQYVGSVYAPAGETNYNSLASCLAQEPVTLVA